MILRTCNADFTSAHDPSFQWPDTVGAVVHPREWDPSAECGNGLHGFLLGEGERTLADWSDDAQWIVFEGDIVVDIDGDKVKTNKATILHIGQGPTAYDRLQDCHAFMRRAGKLGPRAFNSVNVGGVGSINTGGNGAINTGGDYSTNTGGDYSTIAGGDYSTNFGGYGSTITGGDDSTNTGGDDSTNTGGDCSTNTGGVGSTNTGGDYSVNTGGYGSTNTGGYNSTNTGGDFSTNIGGNFSTNTGGNYSTNTGGDRSTFQTGANSSFTGEWYDGERRHRAIFYSGEQYEAGVKYRFEQGIISRV